MDIVLLDCVVGDTECYSELPYIPIIALAIVLFMLWIDNRNKRKDRRY